MTIRLATFNMENVFTRPAAMSGDTWAEGAPALEAFAKLGRILQKPTYSEADQALIKEILETYGPPAPKASRFIRVEQIREKLFTTTNGKVTVKAAGHGDWVGWIDLVKDSVDPRATLNTARVVEAVNADVLLTVEVEDRLTLARFNDQILHEKLGLAPYPYNALFDGNDERGIDIGIFSRYPIRSVRPHPFDADEIGTIFSRDCPEFEVELPGGAILWVLGNHWKSKGYGSNTGAKRMRQANRVEQIYREALERGEFVAVMGDLNDTKSSTPVQVLTTAGLQDVMGHPLYKGTPGTYGTGNTENQKLDYLFLSPELWSRVRAVGIERRGVYAPSLASSIGPLFATSHLDEASDHAAVSVDLDMQ